AMPASRAIVRRRPRPRGLKRRSAARRSAVPARRGTGKPLRRKRDRSTCTARSRAARKGWPPAPTRNTTFLHPSRAAGRLTSSCCRRRPRKTRTITPTSWPPGASGADAPGHRHREYPPWINLLGYLLEARGAYQLVHLRLRAAAHDPRPTFAVGQHARDKL